VAVDHRPFGKDRAAFEAALQRRWRRSTARHPVPCGVHAGADGGFVEAWQGRMLNIHPSLLPKYRGLDTHARAIAAGDAEAGCTVHEVTPALDDGPILGQARVPVLPGDTPETLAARVLEGAQALPGRAAPLRRGDRRPDAGEDGRFRDRGPWTCRFAARSPKPRQPPNEQDP
jgi:phosphoribosylglycinamide formyltransferase-1